MFGTTYGRGAITDALSVYLSSVEGENNKVGYVYQGHTDNLPYDCGHGIREVYYYNSSNVFVKIIGSDRKSKYSEWGNFYNGTTWTGWILLSSEHLSSHFLNLTLPDTSALEICKYIRENINADIMRDRGYQFNALVNGGDWFSGTIYSDGGNSHWGTVHQRAYGIEPSTLYKYVSFGGADSVAPFNSGKIIPITVSGKAGLTDAWTVDLGVKVNSFMWYCTGVTNLSYNCSGMCYGNYKGYISQALTDRISYSLEYTISGTKVTFPTQPCATFKNGATVYFMVI